MKLLLDTPIYLWWIGIPQNLSDQEIKLIKDTKNIVYISAASIWEISIKRTLGKLTAPEHLEKNIETNDFLDLPITIKHAAAIEELPDHHRDLFDRMLIAQAMVNDLILVSRDQFIPLYAKSSIDQCPSAYKFSLS